MEFRSILALCISTPLTITVAGFILIRLRHLGMKRVGFSASKDSVGITAESESGETPARTRIPYETAEIEHFVSLLVPTLVPALREATSHVCEQRDLLAELVIGQEGATSLGLALAEDAINNGKNGPIKKAYERVAQHEREYADFRRARLVI